MIITAIVLLIVALAFVVAELFIPSHGVLAVFAVIAAGAAIYFAFQSSAILGLLFTVITVISAPVVFYYAIKIYPSTPVGKRILLDGSAAASNAQPFEAEAARLSQLVGRHGLAITVLRPAGRIEIDNQYIDAVSEAEQIEAGSQVEVLRVSGLKVIVKAVANSMGGGDLPLLK